MIFNKFEKAKAEKQMMTKDVFKKETNHLDAKTKQFKAHIEKLVDIDSKMNWEVAGYMDDIDNDNVNEAVREKAQ